MKRFYCHCGQEIFFENSLCHSCGSLVSMDLTQLRMISIIQDGAIWKNPNEQSTYHLCSNRENYAICNGVIEDSDNNPLCISCRLNQTVPDLSKPINSLRWKIMEQAKRRLVFGLLSIGLPLEVPLQGKTQPPRFDFLEDKRSNPKVKEEFVTTGHERGVITINLLEADEIQRTWERERGGERYRTVLGHMRHEMGHFYFEYLTQDKHSFFSLFGDPNIPYDEAMETYYEQGPLAGWENSFISAYASAHPLEDWAECFAHYLHMMDVLETATQFNIISHDTNINIDGHIEKWDKVSVIINEVNRSLGLNDAYPFVIHKPVANKIRYIHSSIQNLV